MIKTSGEQGFIKGLVVFTVGICVIFIFLFQFAQYFQGADSTTLFSGLSTGVDSSNSYEASTNPLLDFGNSSYDQYYGGQTGRTVPNTDGVLTSPYAGKVRLSSGNASYSNQTYEEYVTITNQVAEPITITGWTLTNGKGSRPVENRQNNYVYPTADSATIGEGTEFLSPDGNFRTGSIVLRKGDVAYLTTGKHFGQFPFSIYTSFRENICVGYLKNYPFAPSVNASCPYVSNDPQIRTVTDPCYDYIRTIGRCGEPEKTDKERYDLLTTQCRAFIAPRVGYEGCVAFNKDAENFSMNQWRIFLNKDRELWASSRETITLYDAQGFIVDRVTY